MHQAKHLLRDTIIVIIGNLILAFGVAVFAVPSDLIVAGATGIALIICEFPPDTNKHRNGNKGACSSSGLSLIKWAKTCACKWFTSIIGTFNDAANPFANEVPTNKDPNNPGPRVNAIAFNSDFLIPARLIASDTTGTIFC